MDYTPETPKQNNAYQDLRIRSRPVPRRVVEILELRPLKSHVLTALMYIFQLTRTGDDEQRRRDNANAIDHHCAMWFYPSRVAENGTRGELECRGKDSK